MQWNWTYIILIITCTVISWSSALLIEKYRNRSKIVLIISVSISLIILGFYKYLGLLETFFNAIRHCFGIEKDMQCGIDILLPVGISFFTLQAIGYVVDVYRGHRAEHSFIYYALFISFFPQLVAGPIERYDHLMPQLKQYVKLNWDAFRKGVLLILYGLFCKMVIADRLAMIVDAIYARPDVYTGLWIVFGTVCFSIQIYCDFYGYSTIARGSALLLGIDLVNNFSAPYLSTSVKEFWRRWHISLSYWFRDYVYIPMGGNKKGLARKEGNLIFTFSLSGLWHGASLAFVIWGG